MPLLSFPWKWKVFCQFLKRGVTKIWLWLLLVTKSDTRNQIFEYYPELSAKRGYWYLHFCHFWCQSRKVQLALKTPNSQRLFSKPGTWFSDTRSVTSFFCGAWVWEEKIHTGKKNIRLEKKRTDHHQIQISNLWKKQCFGNLELHWLQWHSLISLSSSGIMCLQILEFF